MLKKFQRRITKLEGQMSKKGKAKVFRSSDGVTKTEVHKSSVGNKKGWAFSLYWKNRAFPNMISALYKTKREAAEKLDTYLKTDKFDWYGSAE